MKKIMIFNLYYLLSVIIAKYAFVVDYSLFSIFSFFNTIVILMPLMLLGNAILTTYLLYREKNKKCLIYDAVMTIINCSIFFLLEKVLSYCSYGVLLAEITLANKLVAYVLYGIIMYIRLYLKSQKI